MNMDKSSIQTRVIGDILKERDSQDDRWGESNHHPFVWASILGEEYGEVCKAANESHFAGYRDTGRLERYRAELVQVAAVAMAAIECVDRNELTGE